MLNFEAARNPDPERRCRVQLLISSASDSVSLDDRVEQRGAELEAMGFGAFDALHVVSAESAQVDVLLTTDDALVRLARRREDRWHVRVENPLAWLKERSES